MTLPALSETAGRDVVRPMPRRKQLQLNGDLKVALPRSRRAGELGVSHHVVRVGAGLEMQVKRLGR